jgi:hypothetical protein
MRGKPLRRWPRIRDNVAWLIIQRAGSRESIAAATKARDLHCAVRIFDSDLVANNLKTSNP